MRNIHDKSNKINGFEQLDNRIKNLLKELNLIS